MARKSKGKFKLPTSAFKMESPLRETDNSQMKFDEIEIPKITRNMSLEQGDEESGWQYLTRQLGIRQALKNKKKKTQETDPSKNQKDQTNKYDPKSEYAEFGTDPRQDDNNYDEHGNYKPDYPELYPDFEVAPTLSSEGKMESLISDLPEDHPGRGGEVDPNYVPPWQTPSDKKEEVKEETTEYEVMPDHPGDKDYSYRKTPDGGYEYSHKGGEWITATGKGLEAIKKRYDK